MDGVEEFAGKIFAKTGRNDHCPCGSGKKFKKCHLSEIEAAIASNAIGDYGTRKKLITASASHPVYKCLIGADWKLHGLARVIVARSQPNGRLVYGVFLVDLLCLGVKSAFCNAEMTEKEFENIFIPAQFFDTPTEEITLNLPKLLFMVPSLTQKIWALCRTRILI